MRNKLVAVFAIVVAVVFAGSSASAQEQTETLVVPTPTADSEVVTITVNEAGNQLPVLAAIGARSTTEGANLNFGISAADVDGPAPGLSTSALPGGATFIDNGDGTGTFDWTPDFTQAGAYNVTFRATDDSLAVDSEIVTVTVFDAGNQTPVLATIGFDASHAPVLDEHAGHAFVEVKLGADPPRLAVKGVDG